MKKVLNVVILFLLGLVNVYGQSTKKTYTTKSRIYNTISEIPFLNTDRAIFIEGLDSSNRLNKKYIKIMKAVVTAKNEKKLIQANNKALDFF